MSKAKQVSISVETDDTFVIGLDGNGNCVFIKSFHYRTEKEKCQQLLKEVQNKFAGWLLTFAGSWKLDRESGESYKIKMEMP